MNINEERFWSYVDKSGGPSACWLWTAARFSHSGYGCFGVGSGCMAAHRVSWMLARPMCPPPPVVMHTCDVRACCNPDHLRAGTQADNNRDMREKNRHAHGDGHGLRKHPERRAYGARNANTTHPERKPRGERHGRCVYSDETVRAIRRLAAEGMTGVQIAKAIGVPRNYAHQIIANPRLRASAMNGY